ncbi:hypothetical protein [Hoeflea olei]|uniref:Uncharacterized protein n=1 Tax=Hoeflea olei TaxID=1480615 RepID=A0A1C1Z058_9HYPH|nr:hypothetical protein [Hoeflea olei]OCW59026.1 hypothetical protein AWJ14_04790 [Hoeflea olei]
MVEYTPQNRPEDYGRSDPRIRETTIVESRSSSGLGIVIVAVILLVAAGFVFWSYDNDGAAPVAAPDAGVSEQVAPAPDPALSVPAAPEAAAPEAGAEQSPTPVAPGATPAIDG